MPIDKTNELDNYESSQFNGRMDVLHAKFMHSTPKETDEKMGNLLGMQCPK